MDEPDRVRQNSLMASEPRVAAGRFHVSRALLRAAHHALYWSGAGAFFVRTRTPQGALILMYHGIVGTTDAPWIDPRFSVTISTFEAQMKFLKRYRNVISMSDLLDRIERASPIPAGTVVITFDDGYKNNLDFAAPVLRHYDLPATLYLATGYVSRGQAQFIDTLFAAFRRRSRHFIVLADQDFELAGDLRDRQTARRLYLNLGHRLMVSSYQARERLLNDVVEQLRPDSAGPRVTLTWEEVGRLRRSFPRIEIGVHTRNHIDLTSCAPDETWSEIAGSIEDARREMGIAPAHFSFPFGRSNAAGCRAAARAALRSAAVTEPAALSRAGADVFRLSRLAAPDSMNLFPFYTSGAYPELSHDLLGRA